jgi:hypothetical protein
LQSPLKENCIIGNVSFKNKQQTTSDIFILFCVFPLQAMQQIETSGNSAVRSLKWFFSEVEPGRENDYATYTAAQGAVFGFPTVTTITTFRDYFVSLNVNNPPAENPWLQDWYSRKYKCYFSAPTATYT